MARQELEDLLPHDRRISALDAVGIASILHFAQPIIESGGTGHVIDPDEHLRHLVDPQHRGIIHHAGVAALVLLLVGGALYTVGAVFYATRWPNPWP